jgi:WD40 repeat protein
LRHADRVHSLIFSPDGKSLASLGDDWRLSLWDTATGREQAHIPSYFHALAFAPDGRTLTTLWAGRLAQWDRHGKKLRTLREFPQNGARQALTSDGALTAIEDWETHAISVWDPIAGKERHRFTGHKTFIGSLSFARNGKVLVSQGRAVGEPTLVWDVEHGRRLLRIEYDDAYLHPPALSPDGQLLAMPGEKDVALWDIAKGKRVRTLNQRQDGSPCAAFTADGRTLVTNSGSPQGSSICLWRVSDGKKVRQWTLSHGVQQLTISPDDKLLAATSEHAVCLFDMAGGKELHADRGHRGVIETVLVMANGRRIVTCSHSVTGEADLGTRHDDSLQIWDPSTGQRLHGTSSLELGLILAIAGSLDGGTLALLCQYPDSKAEKLVTAIRLWDCIRCQEIRLINADDVYHLATLSFSPDGKTLVSGGKPGYLFFWDVATGKKIRELSPKMRQQDLQRLAVTSPRFSPDGRRLAAALIEPGPGGGKTRMYLWDFATEKERQLEGFPVWRADPVFSSDGKMLAILEETAENSGRQFLRLYEVESGQRRDSQLKGSGEVYLFALAPGGEVLATVEQVRSPFGSAERARRIRLWDLVSGEEIGHFDRHRGVLHSLAFSAEGRLLVSGSADTTALVWDVSALVRDRKRPVTELSRRAFDALWNDLDSNDAARVSASFWRLVAGQQTAAFLRERLRPVSAIEPGLMKRLLAELDSDEFAVREDAARDVEEWGEGAIPSLRKALANHPSLEMRRRIENILTRQSARNLRLLRAVEVLEHIGSDEARELLQTLAPGAADARLTREAKASLQRLERRRIKP